VIALVSGSCAPVPRALSTSGGTPRRIADVDYRSAASHCHSEQVIRMRPSVRNVFYVGGLVDPRTGKPSGADDAARIECVRKYLGLPQEDVIIVFS